MVVIVLTFVAFAAVLIALIVSLFMDPLEEQEPTAQPSHVHLTVVPYDWSEDE